MENQEHLAMEVLHSFAKRNKCITIALIVSLTANIVMTVVAFAKK